MPIKFICVDADDTLWHHETFFRDMQGKLVDLLAPYGTPDHIDAHLSQIEHRNLAIYGYGAKAFTLSMMEMALDISDRRLSGAAMSEILALGRELLRHPVEPLPGVEAALRVLADRAPVVLVTKGDLFHQEAKLAASGLGQLFSGVEVVSDKTAPVYRRVFARYGVEPSNAVMAGNSIRSDVLPPLEAGAYAALIPYPLVWAHEAATVPADHPRFRELSTLEDLPRWLETIDEGL